MSLIAEGGNYRIELQAGVAVCRVWRRPDVSLQGGAAFAAEKVGPLCELAGDPGSPARALLLDLEDAPQVVGTETQSSLATILARWEAAGRRVAVHVGDNAIRELQMARLCREHAPTRSAVFTTRADAERWVSSPG